MKIHVGICGIDYSFGNLGCEALAYSLINILQKESEKLDITLEYRFFFFKENEDELLKICNIFNIERKNINVTIINFKNCVKMLQMLEDYKKCDFIIDMSGGDSFSDIYGLRRMVKEFIFKKNAINKKIPLILGPQTYGPYKRKISQKLASKIFSDAFTVFARDEESAKLVNEISGINPIISTDLALRLPHKRNNNLTNTKNIGINVSALMWHVGYGKNNSFGITIDYREYIDKIIRYLKDNITGNIYLISHVNASGIEKEDDYLICSELSKKYNVNLAPKFADPIEAKNFIADLDLLIASRMHASIAAFSSGVPTIPVAYSKKFEGLYKSLSYNYYIDAKIENTESALQKTIEFILNTENMKVDLEKALKIADEKLSKFDNKIDEFLLNLRNKNEKNN